MKTIIFVFVVVMLAIAGTSVNRKPIGLSAVDCEVKVYQPWWMDVITMGGSLTRNTNIDVEMLAVSSYAGTWTITIPPTTTSPGKATR